MVDLLVNLSIFSFDAASFYDWFVENANYWFVFIFMVVESSFIPFPSELVVPPAAYLATANGSASGMNLPLIVIVATAGALVGSLVNYYLALWLGRPIIYAFVNSRLGRACLLDEAKIQKAEAYFDKHGAASTFFGRLIPAVRQLISIPAGLAKMNIGKFCAFTALGAGLWNCVLAGLGYWLGKVVHPDDVRMAIEKYNSYLTYIGLGIAALCLAYILWNAFKPKKDKDKTKDLSD